MLHCDKKNASSKDLVKPLKYLQFYNFYNDHACVFIFNFHKMSPYAI